MGRGGERVKTAPGRGGSVKRVVVWWKEEVGVKERVTRVRW